jgi:hypothetical protein
MKTIISRTLLTLAISLVAFAGVFGQITAPTGFTSLVAPTGSDAIDTVTIGSVMPYRVTGDVNMHLLRSAGILTSSQYTKEVSAGGAMLNASGLPSSTPLATDSAFSVQWGTIGGQSVKVTEAPQAASGHPAFTCAANTETLNVFVVSRPKAVWGAGASASGCGVAGTTVTVPFTLTGTGTCNVSYRIAYTTLAGATSDVVSSAPLNIEGGSVSFSYAVPASAYGTYNVYIEGLYDRISKKSGVATIAGTDYPTSALTFYAYPTPVTSPIQHVKNL